MDRVRRSGLDALETQVATSNPTLQGALDRYQQAEGYLGEIRSGLLPTVGTQATITQNRQSDNRPLRGHDQPNEHAASTVGGTVAWNLYLWGGLRNRVVAGRAEVQATGDDLAAIRLSLEAQLATQYVRLRGLDAQVRLLDAAVNDYAQADDLTQRRFKEESLGDRHRALGRATCRCAGAGRRRRRRSRAG